MFSKCGFCDLKEEANGSKVVGVTIRGSTLSFLS